MITKGRIVEFSIDDARFNDPTKKYVGTVMAGEENGLVIVAVHDQFFSSNGMVCSDKNILPVFAIRAGAIGRVLNSLDTSVYYFQGDKR